MKNKPQMNIYMKIFLISIIIILILAVIFGIYIVPKQLRFINNCESICNEKNMGYETTFMSYPTNVNGKCYCIIKDQQTKGDEKC